MNFELKVGKISWQMKSEIVLAFAGVSGYLSAAKKVSFKYLPDEFTSSEHDECEIVDALLIVAHDLDEKILALNILSTCKMSDGIILTERFMRALMGKLFYFEEIVVLEQKVNRLKNLLRIKLLEVKKQKKPKRKVVQKKRPSWRY